MAEPNLPEPPTQLKAIQSYMRVAQDVNRYDPVVAYWLRLFSTETALKIDKDSPECKKFLVALLSWLEKFKQTHKDNETVINQTVGQAHYDNFVMSLFNKADTLDREGTANKNTVKMFYMASVMFEAMAVFGQLTEEVNQRAKYAKFKAAYIQKCLKMGQTPKPGPIEGDDLEEGGGGTSSGGAPSFDVQPTQPAAGTPSSPFPQMPTMANHPPSTDNLEGVTGGGGLYLPEVPKDSSENPGPASAIIPPKPTDPYILTPSVPPPKSNPVSTTNWNKPQTDGNKSTIAEANFQATNGAPLKPEDILKGQKYCKFASSALQYDDIATAVTNLQKALKLLTTGQNPD